MLHMWWTCKQVNQLWKETAKLIKRVTKHQLPLDPKTILLRSLQGNIPKPIRKTIYLIL
ncbi:Hypothetical predicted protein, partial [Pelobates cultripes]